MSLNYFLIYDSIIHRSSKIIPSYFTSSNLMWHHSSHVTSLWIIFIWYLLLCFGLNTMLYDESLVYYIWYYVSIKMLYYVILSYITLYAKHHMVMLCRSCIASSSLTLYIHYPMIVCILWLVFRWCGIKRGGTKIRDATLWNPIR